ncbi:MAG: hypothetical protein AVDCRST_MAG59-1164 [uncultured Thermomicrobiales bacterium]|uniref:Uncharacterized protein n=1 Tax=uncultured Thermomicrobiales bacterium TaxID=1645740 RepID=A0A6J4UA99_9BACT|nr:MAG: hypothetical protein AVDCRST_MAG59-1164 [uncultured Thermomicrobiales bacterium]
MGEMHFIARHGTIIGVACWGKAFASAMLCIAQPRRRRGDLA